MAIAPLLHRFDGPFTAPVILMIPALGTRWSMWEPQLPELTRHHRVLRVDLPGHGGSPAAMACWTPQAQAARLDALLDDYSVDRVAVVGADLGAMVAVALADRAPRRVERLALLSCAVPRSSCRRWRHYAQEARRHGMDAVLSAVTRPWFTPRFIGRRPDVVAAFAAEFAKMSVDTFAACCEAATTDMRGPLSRVKAQTLVISAAHDPQAPPTRGRVLAAALSQARFEVVKGAAHLANVERSDRVNQLLVAHLGLHGGHAKRAVGVR